MIYRLTNIAKTQDVPLDGTIFFGSTGQKDKATFMNNNNIPKLVETYRNQVLQHSLTKKARGHVHAYKCCHNLGCPVGRYHFLR